MIHVGQRSEFPLITHHHSDHFDAGLFLPRAGWRAIGPPSVTAELPAARVLMGDSVTVGAFSIIAIATPHTEDHRFRPDGSDRVCGSAEVLGQGTRLRLTATSGTRGRPSQTRS